MEVQGVNFWPEDVIRTYDELRRHTSEEITIKDAIAAAKAGFECLAYERYLVAKLDQEARS